MEYLSFLADYEEISDLYDWEYRRSFIIKDWKWEYWEEVGNDGKIQVLPYTDNNNRPHGIKPYMENILNNFLQFKFEYTPMNWYFFNDLLLRAISTHKNTWQEGTWHYTLGMNRPP